MSDHFSMWDEQADDITAQRLGMTEALAVAAVQPLETYLAGAQSPAEFGHRLSMAQDNVMQALEAALGEPTPEIVRHANLHLIDTFAAQWEAGAPAREAAKIAAQIGTAEEYIRVDAEGKEVGRAKVAESRVVYQGTSTDYDNDGDGPDKVTLEGLIGKRVTVVFFNEHGVAADHEVGRILDVTEGRVAPIVEWEAEGGTHAYPIEADQIYRITRIEEEPAQSEMLFSSRRRTAGFWDEIKAQLARISKAKTADEVIAILNDDQYTEAREYGAHNTGPDAFFGGSGGDDSLMSALSAAGWSIVWAEASYYYVAKAPNGDLLTYVEGDVFKGDQSIRQGSRKHAESGVGAPLVVDGVEIRIDKDGWIGWMGDWGAPYDRDWIDKGWVTSEPHNSGGLGGASFRLTDEGRKQITAGRRTAEEDRKGHSKTCPKCGATLSSVVQYGDTLSASCDACGWSGSKKRTTSAAEPGWANMKPTGETYTVPCDTCRTEVVFEWYSDGVFRQPKAVEPGAGSDHLSTWCPQHVPSRRRTSAFGYDSSEEPCCMAYVTSGGGDHEPGCPVGDRLPDPGHGMKPKSSMGPAVAALLAEARDEHVGEGEDFSYCPKCGDKTTHGEGASDAKCSTCGNEFGVTASRTAAESLTCKQCGNSVAREDAHLRGDGHKQDAYCRTCAYSRGWLSQHHYDNFKSTAANPAFSTPQTCLCPADGPRGRRDQRHYEIRDDESFVRGPFDRLHGGPGSANYSMMGLGETIGFGSTPNGPGLHIVEVDPGNEGGAHSNNWDPLMERYRPAREPSVRVVGSKQGAGLTSDEYLRCRSCDGVLKGNYDHVECTKCGTGYDPKSYVADEQGDGPWDGKVLRIDDQGLAKVVQTTNASMGPAVAALLESEAAYYRDAPQPANQPGEHLPDATEIERNRKVMVREPEPDNRVTDPQPREAVNMGLDGAARYQSTPVPDTPDWINDAWGQDTNPIAMLDTDRANPFSKETLERAERANKEARRRAVAEVSPDLDGFAQSDDAEVTTSTDPRTTRPRVVPKSHERPLPGPAINDPVVQTPEVDLPDADLAGFATPTMAQRVQAKTATIARRVLADNPSMSREQAASIAAETLRAYPEMLRDR